MWWTLSSPALLFAATVSVIRSDSPQSLQVSDDFHSENWPHKILIPTQFQFQFHLNRSFVAHIPHSQRDSFKWFILLDISILQRGNINIGNVISLTRSRNLQFSISICFHFKRNADMFDNNWNEVQSSKASRNFLWRRCLSLFWMYIYTLHYICELLCHLILWIFNCCFN